MSGNKAKPGEKSIISRRTILEIYQLKEQGFTVRSIARQLQINRENSSQIPCKSPEWVRQNSRQKNQSSIKKNMIDKSYRPCPDVKAPVSWPTLTPAP